MSVSFLIGSFGDLPFEKPQNFTTHPLGLSHSIMNGWNVGTAYGANATLMQGLERRRIAQFRAEIYIQKEVVIAPLHGVGVVVLRRS